jgi:hypothetical protein
MRDDCVENHGFMALAYILMMGVMLIFETV